MLDSECDRRRALFDGGGIASSGGVSGGGRTVTVRLAPEPMRNDMEWLRRYERFWSASFD
jgi:hypothetical protein